MEIIGYSERGAMNALFYGIALNENEVQGEKDIIAFLTEAKIINANSYHNFKIFTEFSLSEFGSPDLVIFANNKCDKDQLEVFFIEAKASCCKKFDLNNQKKQYEQYVGKTENKKYSNASNLFFQLRLKYYYYQLKDWFNGSMRNTRPSISFKEDKKNRIKQTRGHERVIGNNPIVRKFVETFKECKKEHYIAIIPKQEIDISVISEYGFQIHVTTWEALCKNDLLKGYLNRTIEFNKREEISQIINNKK